MFGKIDQSGITWKIRKREQSFLCATHRCDLIYIPIMLHEDIRYGYPVMACTRMFGKKIKRQLLSYGAYKTVD